MSTVDITSIPDHILVRLFMRKLWQAYDSGGHSVGRSLASFLLEGYLGLHECRDLPDIPVDLRGLSDEAQRRQPVLYRHCIFGNPCDLSVVSNYDISMLCLLALMKWYEIHRDERCPAGYVANGWEERFLEGICTIVPLPYFPHITRDSDMFLIAQEAQDRSRMSLETEEPIL
jgi:hypothetical protein